MTAEIRPVSFTSRFTVGTTQGYAFWHSFWGGYGGRLVNANQDGIFLYNRNVGETWLLSFTSYLQLAHFQFLQGLGDNWEVHTSDFTGQGHSHILCYDPSSGDARMLVLKQDLLAAGQRV